MVVESEVEIQNAILTTLNTFLIEVVKLPHEHLQMIHDTSIRGSRPAVMLLQYLAEQPNIAKLKQNTEGFSARLETALDKHREIL